MHASPTMTVDAAAPVPVTKEVPVKKTYIGQQIFEWVVDWPEKPTIWDRLLYPFKWCIVATGFVVLAGVVAVAGVVIVPMAILKMALMIPG